MSVSYTGEAIMDEPALRDVERWKDKIEVRLDNRQVFFLFFGSALCACMLFVLGVIVGKRLESRGRATSPEVQDPLAVLDRINAAGPAGSASTTMLKTEAALTFPKALIAAPARGRAMAGASSLTPAPSLTSIPTAPVRVPALPARAQPLAARPPAPSSASGAAAKASSLAVKSPALSPAARPPAAVRPPAIVAKTPASAPRPAAAPVVAPLPPASAANPGAKARFTLQLSSFPDRDEADTFARRFSSQGAYVVVSEIPGKGTWYRVRVGSYASSQEAIAAKGSFERQNNVIAYIAGR